MTRVIGYLRCSTTDQADSGLGLAAQRLAIAQEAERRGWSDVEYVEDGGFSGGSLNRPGIAALLPRLRRGDVLVVSKLDRLSRSLVDAVGMMEQAQKRGWVLVALDLGVDTGTPTGRLVASVMAAVASWEREVIGQRTRDAMAVAKSDGQRFGRPSTLPPSVQDRIAADHLAGVSLAQIARDLAADRVRPRVGTRGGTRRACSPPSDPWPTTASRASHDGKRLMADRYFVKVSGADFDRIMGVLRLRDEVVQEMWTGTAWVPTEVVMAALVVDPCSTRCPPRRPSGTPPSMSG